MGDGFSQEGMDGGVSCKKTYNWFYNPSFIKLLSYDDPLPAHFSYSHSHSLERDLSQLPKRRHTFANPLLLSAQLRRHDLLAPGHRAQFIPQRGYHHRPLHIFLLLTWLGKLLQTKLHDMHAWQPICCGDGILHLDLESQWLPSGSTGFFLDLQTSDGG